MRLAIKCKYGNAWPLQLPVVARSAKQLFQHVGLTIAIGVKQRVARERPTHHSFVTTVPVVSQRTYPIPWMWCVERTRLQPIFKTETLAAADLGFCFIIAGVVFFAVEVEKWFVRCGFGYRDNSYPVGKGEDMNRTGWLMLLSPVAALSLGIMQDALSAPEDMLKPCQEDVRKYCAKVKPGRGRMSRCLKEHDADLSQACKAHLENMREHMLEAREACSDDAKKFCEDAKPGQGRIVACLKSHENELSDACKEEMKR